MVKHRKVNGRKVWEVDRLFTRVDGGKERYRKRAQVQTREGAEAEEMRVVEHWLRHGTLEKKNEPQADPNATWDKAVAHFREHELPLRKHSTRLGYERLLDSKTFGFLAGRKLTEVEWAREVRLWMLKLSGGPSTKRNNMIVLRAVLRSVSPNKKTAEPGLYFHQMPLLPGLPKVGRTVVKAPTTEEVERLLGEKEVKYCSNSRVRKNQLPMALGAYAGLRASEVRGLKVQDVDLRRGVIVIKTGRVRGVEGAPKSGHERVIPIGPRLRERLEERLKERGLKPDSYVCAAFKGRPWSDHGILAAYHRAAKRTGIEGFSFHSLRHFFITTLLSSEGGGADIRTAQALAGHADITTTSRYAHTTLERGRTAILQAFGGAA